MGVPDTSGFPAEVLLILSALSSHTGAGFAQARIAAGAGTERFDFVAWVVAR